MKSGTATEQRPAETPAEQQTEPQTETVLLIAIVILLLANLPRPQLGARLSALLAPVGLPPASIVALLLLIGNEPHHTPPDSTTPALHAMQRTAATRRARYILAAARRLATGEPIAAERRLFNAHLAAERRRQDAARAVDAAAARYGPILGWNSEKDERTTPACREAHGQNFLAAKPPAIGWPGTLHGGNCRCIPVAPWSQALLLP